MGKHGMALSQYRSQQIVGSGVEGVVIFASGFKSNQTAVNSRWEKT